MQRMGDNPRGCARRGTPNVGQPAQFRKFRSVAQDGHGAGGRGLGCKCVAIGGFALHRYKKAAGPNLAGILGDSVKREVTPRRGAET